MEIVFLIFLILSLLLWFYTHSSADEKIDAYIRERKGTFVSKKREYFDLVSLFSKNTSTYKLIYYDKNEVLRMVLLRISTYGSVDFIDDHEVHSNDREFHITRDPVKPVGKENHGQAKNNLVDYTYKCNKGVLIIQQEFYQPNKGEQAFLNNEKAPDGKYKIGFMNFIVIENGRVKELTMT